MTQTLAALLFAHVLADFVLQTNWIAQNKHRPGAMALHIVLVGATAVAASGQLTGPLLALTLAHLAIDLIKSRFRPGLWPFLADQAAHLVTIAAVAGYAPSLMPTGLWSAFPQLPTLMAATSGMVVATRAGGFAVGFLMNRWIAAMPDGLPNAGRMIGLLERGLIFVFVLSDQPQAIGFLIAAKSVLRFGSVGDDRAASEYVIIGTLASFGWALLAAYATTAMLAHLPALGIPPATP